MIIQSAKNKNNNAQRRRDFPPCSAWASASRRPAPAPRRRGPRNRCPRPRPGGKTRWARGDHGGPCPQPWSPLPFLLCECSQSSSLHQNSLFSKRSHRAGREDGGDARPAARRSLASPRDRSGRARGPRGLFATSGCVTAHATTVPRQPWSPCRRPPGAGTALRMFPELPAQGSPPARFAPERCGVGAPAPRTRTPPNNWVSLKTTDPPRPPIPDQGSAGPSSSHMGKPSRSGG